MVTQDFISISTASKNYNVSRRTIARLIKRGELPCHRIGRQIRLLTSDLFEFTRSAGLAPPGSNVSPSISVPPCANQEVRNDS